MASENIKHERIEQVIEQLTRRKLEHSRQLLKSIKSPYTGNRDKIRSRLKAAYLADKIDVERLKQLLQELDTWGQQRIRIGHLEEDVLNELNSTDSITGKAKRSGMEKILDGIVDFVPPEQLTPMVIDYSEESGRRILRVVAAKTRQLWTAISDLPEIEFRRVFNILDNVDPALIEKYADVIYKPFKKETQKAIDFAEIDLDTGFTLVSTTLIRRGNSYSAEFEEFYKVFDPFITLRNLKPVQLFDANGQIYRLPLEEVKVLAHNLLTDVGGSLRSNKADIRSDQQLHSAHSNLLDAPKPYCNCEWQTCPDLDEVVHTHVYAPAGEISILGQVTEKSVRYVLRKITNLA